MAEFNNEVTIKTLVQLLRHQLEHLWSHPALAQDIPPLMIWGAPGLGKSMVVRELAAEFGVGVVCLEIADERLCELPGAEEIFKAGDEECAALLAELTPVRLASSRLKALEADTGETLGGEFGALFDWLAACLERGSVEEYEFRVSCY